MLMKLLQIVMTQFLGQTQNSAATLLELPMASLRKFLMLTSGVVVGLIVFFGGALIVLADLLMSSRDHNQLMLSSVSVVGFALMAFSVLTVAFLMRKSLWKPAAQFEQPVAPPQPAMAAMAPVLEALLGLAHEFLRAQQPMPSSQPQAHTQPQPQPTTAPGYSVPPTEGPGLGHVSPLGPTGPVVATDPSKIDTKASFN